MIRFSFKVTENIFLLHMQMYFCLHTSKIQFNDLKFFCHAMPIANLFFIFLHVIPDRVHFHYNQPSIFARLCSRQIDGLGEANSHLEIHYFILISLEKYLLPGCAKTTYLRDAHAIIWDLKVSKEKKLTCSCSFSFAIYLMPKRHTFQRLRTPHKQKIHTCE